MILVSFFHIPTAFQLRKSAFKSSVHILRRPSLIARYCTYLKGLSSTLISITFLKLLYKRSRSDSLLHIVIWHLSNVVLFPLMNYAEKTPQDWTHWTMVHFHQNVSNINLGTKYPKVLNKIRSICPIIRFSLHFFSMNIQKFSNTVTAPLTAALKR